MGYNICCDQDCSNEDGQPLGDKGHGERYATRIAKTAGDIGGDTGAEHEGRDGKEGAEPLELLTVFWEIGGAQGKENGVSFSVM